LRIIQRQEQSTQCKPLEYNHIDRRSILLTPRLQNPSGVITAHRLSCTSVLSLSPDLGYTTVQW